MDYVRELRHTTPTHTGTEWFRSTTGYKFGPFDCLVDQLNFHGRRGARALDEGGVTSVMHSVRSAKFISQMHKSEVLPSVL